jgi:hypothetical protein
MTEHKNVYMALSAAQAEMGHLVKSSKNEAFKKKDGSPSTYAALADVVDAVRLPFANHGLSYFHAIAHVENLGMCMVTTLAHGASDTSIVCPVPMIIDRNSMHGLKSATTYAKRIGVESVSGIAPEDDDGNEASANPPKTERVSPNKRISSAEMKRQIENIRNDMTDCYSVVALQNLWGQVKRQMDKDGWPTNIEGDEEQTHRAMVINMFADRKKELLAVMAEAPEPNILMAGE